ncbi:DUF6088 family protein [Flavihumibacter sp. UBA7668]|uniref:DUF6088 family protein n=1 Tax=Flavihumibacter sp. UBA7668 TaxID=1946542 RepID=UPI0025C0987C|nr:DUF6088 family protein [Flavihumibacter sp. UBA7668]
MKNSLSATRNGAIIFPSDFRGKGSEGAIKMALSRLVKEGVVERVAHGVYHIPYIDPVLGKLSPAPEEFAEKLAEKEKIKIRPTGIFALNKLGLSTQVPTKLVYLTDGHPRKLKIGNAIIEFKATSPKRMALSGEMSSMLILALTELDLDHLTKEQESRIFKLLQVMDKKELDKDMRLAPAKVYNYLFKLLQRIDKNHPDELG